jgi:hypothetical protein
MQNTVEQANSSSTASNKSAESKPEAAIKCAFLRMAPPDTSNMWRFARDCQKNGLGLLEGLAVGGLVVVGQKGKLALLRGEAPDLYSLDKVKGVSHEDLYLPYLPQVKAKVQALSHNGQLSLQDLAEIKEWIAAQEGVSVSSASKLETVILFIRAGGELDSGLIDADDALRMIEGYEPKKSGLVTFGSIKQARKLIAWSDEAELVKSDS